MKKILGLSIILGSFGLASCASQMQQAFYKSCIDNRATTADTMRTAYDQLQRDFKLKDASTKEAMCRNLSTLPDPVLSQLYFGVGNRN